MSSSFEFVDVKGCALLSFLYYSFYPLFFSFFPRFRKEADIKQRRSWPGRTQPRPTKQHTSYSLTCHQFTSRFMDLRNYATSAIQMKLKTLYRAPGDPIHQTPSIAPKSLH